VEVAEFARLERSSDQEHAVGAHQPGVDDVERRHREVLADDGQRAGIARRLQVGDRTAEELDVGQHREARRPPDSYVRAISAGSSPALRSPFDGERRLISLITASRSAPSAASAERKPRRGRQGSCLVDQRVERPRLGSGDLTVAIEDPVEVGGHRRSEPELGGDGRRQLDDRDTRTCSVVSRSRIVTAPSSSESKSTVTHSGVPISS
jgi:hypothetical protein